MFIAMNRFRVLPGTAGDFERIWIERESYLRDVPGFLQFALLRSDEEGEYISHSTWTSRDAFVAWTESEAFVSGHRQGSLKDVLAGPPEIRLFQSVITETADGREID